MRYHTQHGRFIIILSSLKRSQQFIRLSEGIHWAFVQKLAAACAADMRSD